MEISNILEFAMIALFGVSWPFLVLRMYRQKKVHGVSPVFITLIWLGYAIGLVNKFGFEEKIHWKVTAYIFNIVMVSLAAALYLKYRNNDTPKADDKE